MHNVISSGFFPSGELCWAEGGLVLGMFWVGKGVYVGGSGVLVQRG